MTRSKGLIAQGNLSGAARTIVGGLKDNPKNSELIGTLQPLYSAAEAEATNARQAADAAGAKDRPDTPMATRAFRQHATRLVPLDPRTRRQSFVNSARPQSCTRTAATKVKTAPPVIDELAIRKLLADYVQAYNTMGDQTRAALQAVLQRFPTDF